VGNFISRLKDISTKFGATESQATNDAASPIDPHLESASPPPTPVKQRGWQAFLRNSFLSAPKTIHIPDPTAEISPNPKKPFYHRYVFWIGMVSLGSGAAVAAWGLWSIDRSLPNPSDITTFVRRGTLTLKASDGTILQQLGPATRDKLTFNQIPDSVIKAFVAAEDRRFYKHNGVDYLSIGRAIATNLVARDVVEGGSTITQQLARIVFLNQERTFWRKVQEAFLAQKIERQLSKQQVLERYLNLVYLGSGAYGVADAAWIYFSKPVDQLTLPEIATIAGLPPAPSIYSPLVNLDLAVQRRNLVLGRMQEAGFITKEQAEQAISEPLTLKPSLPKRLYSDTPYFTSYVQQQLPRYVSKEALELGGLTVETTLNYKWQKAAEKTINQAIKVDGPAEGFAQAALVALDPRNGEIRAMVGGDDFKKSQFNRVTQAQRQPGSSFKVMVYTTAIAAGFSPYQTYLDAPYTVDGYQPQNYGKKYHGWMSLRDALTNSLNVVAVKLLIDVGFDPTIKMAHQMGIKSKLYPTYSLALGASEVNVLEMASAYGTIAAEGMHIDPHAIRRVLNAKGEVLYSSDFKAKRILDQGTAAIMTWMLENVVQNGTGRPAQLGRPVAGKTGTSEEARDLWFIGYIPQLVVGVWLGNDDSSPTWGTSGTAAYTWNQFMIKVVQGMPVQKFPKLPKLEGRKGMLKARPVKPNRASNSAVPEKDTTSQDKAAPEATQPTSQGSSHTPASGGGSTTSGTPSAPTAPSTTPATPGLPPADPPAAPPVDPVPVQPPANIIDPPPAAPPSQPAPTNAPAPGN
jgi:penicillin-binding protein 1A